MTDRYPIPTEPGWYWVDLAGSPVVVQVSHRGHGHPDGLGFWGPESKPLWYAVAGPYPRAWGPRVPDWTPGERRTDGQR